MSRYALIAMHEPAMASTYASILEMYGLLPRVFSDGARALERVERRGPPALAAVELSLPVVDGFDVISFLRKRSPLGPLRVVAVSPFRVLRGYAAYSASALGIDRVLARGVTRVALERTLGSLLGRRTSEADIPRESSRSRIRPSRGESSESAAAPPDARLNWFIARVARELLGDIAMVRLDLDDGRTLTATSGLDPRDVRRMDPFTRHVVEAQSPLIVPDALTNPFFKSEPVVKAGLVRGYAGTPLFDAAGVLRGSLSLISSRSRLSLDAEGLSLLAERAAQVGQVISYLGGRAMPRQEGALETPRSKRTKGSSCEWGNLEEADTEPVSVAG